MTYSTWIANRRSTVFPEGEAENLVSRHNKWIQDALIDLQVKVACLQTFHRDQHRAEDSYFDCGASVFDAPVGFIKNIHTILDTDCCDRVFYDAVSADDMRCRMRTQQECGVISRAYGFYEYSSGLYAAYPYYYECQITPDASLDKACRASSGVVALIGTQLYMHPHLDSNEMAVIEWDGLKKTWAADDDMEFGTFERQVQNAVELFLSSKVARHDDHDMKASVDVMAEYNDAVAMMIYECEKLKRLPPTRYCFTNCNSC